MKDEIKRISKLLSLALRHKPEALGLSIDENGWANVEDTLRGLKTRGIEVDAHILESVVKLNDKKRFAFSKDKMKIRANQGHSIDIDVELKEKSPPEVLYHGTVAKYLHLIMYGGLKKMNRQHVHLSHETITAQNVGSRRGKPIILKVDSKKMSSDGFLFYLSENGVWLTDNVPSSYITQQ